RRWRPNVDYRTVYSARRAEGGGVLLDAIHELDLALWWLGLPRRVLSLPRSTGALEADVEDVADAVVEFRSGVVGNFHLNYRDPVYRRSVAIAGSHSVIEGDFARRQVRVRRADSESEPARFSDDRNQMYVGELRALLSALDGA